jgi:N-acetylmuramoyl-L-alanine amidase
MKLKFFLQTLLLLITWLLLQNFNTGYPRSVVPENAGKSTYKIRKVVLDAGHGGKDPGCTGVAKTREKHNALAIVLKVGQFIRQKYPDVEVIYTRDKDVFVELKERAAIANRNNADLFISVHCNSVGSPHIHGAETYVMGLHTAEHNLEVAKRENAAIYLEEDYQKNYGDYDPNSPEAHIFGSIWQSAYLEQSILFASLVQDQAKALAGRENKGVKQAGFLVLRETAMPAVLIETGYLTNRAEEAYLASEEGRERVAMAIFEAFSLYKVQMEGEEVIAETPPAPVKVATPAPAEKGPAAPVAKPVAASTDIPQHAPKPAAQTVVAPEKTSGYRILLMTWPNRVDRNSGKLALLSNVTEEKIDGKYHYFIGTFVARTEAEKMLAEVRNLGFSSASLQVAQ